jgi:hypothetical protein
LPFFLGGPHATVHPTSPLIKDVRVMTIDPKPLTVTVAAARKISGLGNTTIWALIKQGKLEVVRIGRRTLVTFRSLEALLAPSEQKNV